ncbi:MAG: hypothetical protein WA991_00985 [Ornithinimicrobium sp.]
MNWLGVLLDVLAGLGFAWGLIVIHEYGHWAAGRAFGVPADSIQVKMNNPPHVALRVGEHWLSPSVPGYAEAYQAHRAGRGPAWLFIAAGEIAESAAALILLGILLTAGATDVAIVVAWTSLILLVVYVVGDLIVSLTRKAVVADWSAMYALQRLWTVGLAVVLLVVRGQPLTWL